jgi:hypothetical protein
LPALSDPSTFGLGFLAKVNRITQKQMVMTTFTLPQTDSGRLELLNTIYRKGLSTPKQQLAFSADLLVYLRPFISTLSMGAEESASMSREHVRRVVDELLLDIVNDIQSRCAGLGSRRGQRVMAEYGIKMMVFNPFEKEDAMVLAA